MKTRAMAELERLEGVTPVEAGFIWCPDCGERHELTGVWDAPVKGLPCIEVRFICGTDPKRQVFGGP